MEIVETTEPVEVKLSDVCRSCLMKTDNMTNFFSKNKTANDVITMLSSVGNFEVELNDLLPSYLCKNCEEKLRISYDFQLLIQRSNDIIRQCLNGANFVSEFEDNEIEVTKLDSNENISDSAEIEEKPKNKQSMRLPQFSADEVERAIEQSKQKFYANINCIKCGFVSCNTRALSVHMTHLHKEAKEHWCSICNSEVEDLPEHLLSHAHDDLKCKFCGKTFTAKGHFTEHLRSHSNIRPYKCHLCGKGFISTRHLNTHLLTHTNNRPHKCPICPRSFIIQSSLRNHVKNHWQSLSKSESESQERQEDPLRITAEDGLSQIKQLSVPQNFCKICKKKVRSLTAHLSKFHQNSSNREHREKDRVLCTTCGKQFRNGTQFRRHMRTHTGEVPYKCSYCDKRTSSRNQLVVHERTHTGERPHICNICGKGFAQSSVLNTHMKIHTGRPEVCEICLKRFCRPAQLRLHMRKHTGEKPFQCEQCEQAFKQRSHLTEHLKTHSDERPYKCTYCDKGFKQNSSLKSHVQIHLGNKPFKCSQCPYACRQSYSLTQHMRQHSVDSPRPEKPHICSVCHKGFSTVAMLTSHVNNTHNSIYKSTMTASVATFTTANLTK